MEIFVSYIIDPKYCLIGGSIFSFVTPLSAHNRTTTVKNHKIYYFRFFAFCNFIDFYNSVYTKRIQPESRNNASLRAF